ncbi:parvulin-like peptidyl-prolyl isomerase [Haloferula luteola]|uniref:Parvulin-like peptidyl-prolyl isomerase n=1 Tax=Haloferula luteola TaxID=595692 RepID=A0A840V0V8_9BACT|nr:parvulin-like peptidyl-prolyl isomerase [Haloferula luteola]
MTNDSASRIRATFGEEVAAAVETMPVHRWSEPIASGFGLHLIRLEDRIPGRLPSLEEVRPEVEREWSRELRQRTRDGYLESLSQRYQVTIEWPEPSPQS